MSDLTTKEKLLDRKIAYCQAFSDEGAYRGVLEDLAVFCKADQSAFDPIELTNARNEGRREVWLRIQNHLQLTEEQLWELYSRPKAIKL
ncbi:MAG: hypothetical protein SGJ18_15135 [Pseudomonadota bacterium]|nr:hypothetical protein [Pseudomonadota bacterium]